MGEGQSTGIDFSKYTETPAPAAPASSGIDFSKYTGSAPAANERDTPAYWDKLKDKYGLPHSVDLSKSFFDNWATMPDKDFNKVDIEKFFQAYREANPEAPKPESFFGRMGDEAKKIAKGIFSGGLLGGNPMESPTNPVAMFTPPQNPAPAVKERAQEFAEHPAAAAGATATDVGAALLPVAFSKLLDFEGPGASVQKALSRKLSAEEVAAMRSAGTNQPALQVTNGEVLNHASDMGVKLTPGQALEDPAATNVQKMGTTAMVGGKDLHLALREQRYAFSDAMNKLGNTVDPQGLGMSEETAGQTIQKQTQKALDTAKAKANAAYNQVSAQQQDLKGNLRSLYGLADEKQFEKVTDPQTGVAVQRPIYQAPAVAAALKDIQDAPTRLGPNPSIASMRSLRTEFYEKANDFTGNIPDSARALYKQATALVDNSIHEAAVNTPFEPVFRGANAQWKAIESKYNTSGEPLYKILQQNDPTKIISQLQNAPATDITLLRQELQDGPGIQALRRTVLQDIQNHKFTIGPNGMGGYSDSYLKALFGDQTTKELYLKGDVARRISYDANPSGTGSAMSVLEQGGSLKHQPKLTLFSKLSMPKDARSYLPEGLQGRTTMFPAAGAGGAPAAAAPPPSITPPRIGPYLGVRSMLAGEERAQNQ